MRLSTEQFNRMVADHWRQRVDRSLRKAVPAYATASPELREDFLTLARRRRGGGLRQRSAPDATSLR